MDAPILFLDFDGVLHSSELLSSRLSQAPLFEHVDWLTQALAPYPALRIVLSTQWTVAVSPVGARSHLPDALQSRVIGHTLSLYPDVDAFVADSRPDQILRFVRHHGIRHWMAVDDDYRGWPVALRRHWVRTDSRLGLGDLLARMEFCHKLAVLYQQAEKSRDDVDDEAFAATFPNLPRSGLLRAGFDA
jgi:hypothetical protein